MIRQVVFAMAVLAATAASAESKVSGDGTPPAGGKSATQTATPDNAARQNPSRSETARKALGALKGDKSDKDGGKDQPKNNR